MVPHPPGGDELPPDLAYRLLRAGLFRLDAEAAHHLSLRAAGVASRSELLCRAAAAWARAAPDPALAVDAFGLRFDAPVGLAAGLDKDGIAIDLFAALGFGFVEVGTVTPGEGQPGNDRPRLARIVAERAIVNRMGFNNHGAPALARRLRARRTRVPIGANLGKAKVTPLDRAADDYVRALADVEPYADYVAINVSSPNTPNLRDLQAIAALGPLVRRVVEETRALARLRDRTPRPVLLKISPDLADEDLDRIVDLALSEGLAGLIATNTTLDRAGLRAPPPIEGGISGRPLRERAHAVVRRLYARCRGQLPIVGVGGISTPEDAYRRIRAGASLVQVYTGFVYGGPRTPAWLQAGILARLRADGHARLSDVVGADV